MNALRLYSFTLSRARTIAVQVDRCALQVRAVYTNSGECIVNPLAKGDVPPIVR